LICEKTLPGSVSVTSFIDTDTTGVDATVTIINEGVGTASGNVTLTIDGDDIVLPVVANDYAEFIAAALESETIDGWSLAVGTGVDSNIVTLTCLFAGDHVITFEDTDDTGISGVVATVTEGSASEWVYADGSVSGYLPEEYRAS
jgi:phage tail sheath gpL-like